MKGALCKGPPSEALGSNSATWHLRVPAGPAPWSNVLALVHHLSVGSLHLVRLPKLGD